MHAVHCTGCLGDEFVAELLAEIPSLSVKKPVYYFDMPIIIKDFTWTQSDERVCIQLPLKGTKASNMDIVSSSEFCKVSYAPFLFECWFYAKVADEECSAVVSGGVISLTFNKLIAGKDWPDLFHDEFANKQLLGQIRQEALAHAGERAKARQEALREQRAKNKKEALKEQMKIEQEERERIQSVKEKEKVQTSKEIEKFKEASLVAAKERPQAAKQEEQKSKRVVAEEEEEALPAPRACKTLQVKFTPRVFPTPQRESTQRQENEWLENQAEAQRFMQAPADAGDLSANETSLEWLKSKANDFYSQGNYRAALGAFSHALRLFPKVASLYSNRAACHFKLRNLIKCVEDATRALELLTPPVAANAKSRLRAHLRRGSAFCELELYAEGLMDYEAALKIAPDNEEVAQDAANIRQLIVGAPPTLD